MIEKWIKIPGVKYEIDEKCTSIKSLNNHKGRQKIINGTRDKSGYLWFLISIGGKRKRLGLHHLSYRTFVDNDYIPNGREFVLDHIDNNVYNNLPSNLQVISQRYNTVKDKFDKNTSKYVGVCWSKNSKKWTAQIRHNNKKIHLGSFTNEEEAYKAYCKKLYDLTKIKL